MDATSEKTPAAQPYLLTTRQAAKFIGVGEDTLRGLMNRAHNPLPFINLPGCAYPRFTRRQLMNYIDSLSTEQEGA